MAIAPINTLKGWFITAAKPLQVQFHAWMDSFWHKSEKIPVSVVENLTQLLNERKTTLQLESEYRLRPPMTGSGIVNTTVELTSSQLVREVLVWSGNPGTLSITLKADSSTTQEVSIMPGTRSVILINTWFAANEVISFHDSTIPFNYQINTF